MKLSLTVRPLYAVQAMFHAIPTEPVHSWMHKTALEQYSWMKVAMISQSLYLKIELDVMVVLLFVRRETVLDHIRTHVRVSDMSYISADHHRI